MIAEPATYAAHPLHAPDRPLVAARHDHHQIHVAVFVGCAPGVGTKKPDFLRLKLLSETPGRFFELMRADGFHAAEA